MAKYEYGKPPKNVDKQKGKKIFELILTRINIVMKKIFQKKRRNQLFFIEAYL